MRHVRPIPPEVLESIFQDEQPSPPPVLSPANLLVATLILALILGLMIVTP